MADLEGMTAEQLRAMAQDAERRKQESWERSDTDGFLSQWASGLTAHQARAQLEIVEAGGVARFRGLYEGIRRIAARQIETKYGWTWILTDAEAAKFGRKFVPLSSYRGKSRVQKQLGICERHEMAPAKAVISGKGRGLSGSAWVEVVRTGNAWGLDATLCDTKEGEE